MGTTKSGNRVKLTRIPKAIRCRYSIGATVEAESDNSVTGGHFTFTNKAGQEVGVDAVELSGTDIRIQRL
ncbi:MAG TPA: hypothetical protein VJJ47_02815 [Candidatus Paceibacterota bacterium]